MNANGRSPFTFTFAFTRAGSALERRLERPRTPQNRHLHVRIKAPTGAMERTGVIFEVNDAWGVVGAMCVVVTGQNEASGALKFPSMGLICRGAFKAAFGGVHSPEPLNAVHGRVHRANAAFMSTMARPPRYSYSPHSLLLPPSLAVPIAPPAASGVLADPARGARTI